MAIMTHASDGREEFNEPGECSYLSQITAAKHWSSLKTVQIIGLM